MLRYERDHERSRVAKRSKLTELRAWLTVVDAAQYLTRALNEEVTEANIFQFAVERRLTLSARFLDAVRAIELMEKTWQRIEGGDRDFDLIEARNVLPFELPSTIELPDGVYDLPMIGLERFDVEHEYQKRTGGPEVTAPRMSRPTDGPFVKSCTTGSVFWLYCFEFPDGIFKGFEPYRSGRYMPPDTVFIVRPAALKEFVSGMQTVVSGKSVELPDAKTLSETAVERNEKPDSTSESALAQKDRHSLDLEDQDLETTQGRKAAVKTFLALANRHSVTRIEQKHIWRAAKYTNPRQFQYWLKVSKKAEGACDSNIRGILGMSAPAFVRLLTSRGHV